jgi:hypothetical protein
MAASRTVFAVIIFFGLGGCGLGGPQVIAGSEFTVSITAGKWRNPISLADDYCAQYGRKAVEVSHGPMSYDELTVLYVYDCVEK